jgi:signal transduction histidine kinase
MYFSSTKISTIVFFVLLWLFVSFFMMQIVLDNKLPIIPQLVAVILDTSLCLPFAWYTSQKLIPRYLYTKRISTFLAIQSLLLFISTIAILLLSIWVLYIITGIPMFRSLNTSIFLILVTLFVNIIFTSIACVGKIIYDRYFIEGKMIEAVEGKRNTENLLIEEKKNKQHELKEQKEKERKRIAAELHDNLGVQANAILHNSCLLDAGEENNKIIISHLQETAKEMLLNLRETLWAMKTTDVQAIDLWLRIVNFMKQMGRHYTNINFVIEGDLPKNTIITSTKALNVVLVLQETVNNAVKHAAANTITTTSSYAQNKWKIEIKDDGLGFNIANAALKADSYGLQNMKERAIENNFTYTLSSRINEGTQTTITIDNV